MRSSWLAGCAGVLLGVAVCSGYFLFCQHAEPAKGLSANQRQPVDAGGEPSRTNRLGEATAANNSKTVSGNNLVATGSVVRGRGPRGGRVSAPSGVVAPPVIDRSVSGGRAAEEDEEDAEGGDAPPTDYTCAATVGYWLAHLRSTNAETRDNALLHLKQCEAAMAVPRLRELLAEVQDPRLKVDILDTIAFLELPELPPAMMRLPMTTGRAAARPAKPVDGTGK